MPAGRAILLIARAMWAAPIILVLLAAHQVWSAVDIRRTLDEGLPGKAEVLEFYSSDRAEVSHDYVRLRVKVAGQEDLLVDRLTLPHTFATHIEQKKVLDVRVRKEASEPVVIQELGRAHWRLALINSLMSVIGACMLGLGIYAWNRHLARHGDPAQLPAA